jgi:hypothetical protein
MSFLNFIFRIRALSLGAIGATLACSWALCTMAVPSGSRAVAVTRAVGSGLHISNPFIGANAQFPSGGNTSSDPKGFDLGDAVIGSQLSRYISALDGVTPYTFSSTTAGSLGLTVSTVGHVTGTFMLTGTNQPNFNATVLDAAGVTRTGIFFLNPTTATFHFAVDALPQASVGQDYNTNIEVIGGAPANTTFSIVAGSVKLNGAAVPDLETTGLRLFNDGTLCGRPLVAGSISFTAQAIRSGAHALNRAQTAADQPFTIQVLGINSIQSVLATQSATMNVGNGFRDRFQLKAFINTNGQDNTAFANKTLTVRIGNATFSTTLDSGGRARQGTVVASLKALSGALTVQIRNSDLSKVFDTFPSASTQTAVLQISLGETYLGTEAIRFQNRSRRGRAQLRYTLGRDIQLGGLFQIISVKAADFGTSSTAFKIAFLVSHVRGNTTLNFGTPQQATINIGQGFSQSVPLFRGRSRTVPPGIRSVSIDTKRKLGTITTLALPSSQTGVLPGSQGKRQTLLLGVNMSTDTLTFFGEGSAALIPFGSRR